MTEIMSKERKLVLLLEKETDFFSETAYINMRPGELLEMFLKRHPEHIETIKNLKPEHFQNTRFQQYYGRDGLAKTHWNRKTEQMNKS